jgi:hypothetical protein
MAEVDLGRPVVPQPQPGEPYQGVGMMQVDWDKDSAVPGRSYPGGFTVSGAGEAEAEPQPTWDGSRKVDLE